MKYIFPGSTLRALALISFSIFSPHTAFPQNFATLSGTVSDKTGAAVASARVAVQNLDTLVSRETNSDDSGLYTLR